MKNEILSAIQMSGGKGAHYAGSGSITSNDKWYGFVVNEECVIAAITFKRKADNTPVLFTPSWIGKTLTAGVYIPFPFREVSAGVSDQLYADGITVTSGSVLLYIV